MVPCPNCKKLCGVRDAVLRGERLYYRCSRCMDSFDVAAALRLAPEDQVVAPLPPAPKLGPSMSMSGSRYVPVFNMENHAAAVVAPPRVVIRKIDAQTVSATLQADVLTMTGELARGSDADEVTREVTPSLNALIASRSSQPMISPSMISPSMLELTPTLPVSHPELLADLPPPSKTVELDLDDRDVMVMPNEPSESNETPPEPEPEPMAMKTLPAPPPIPTPVPAPGPGVLRTIASIVGGISTVTLFSLIVFAGIIANELDYPRPRALTSPTTAVAPAPLETAETMLTSATYVPATSDPVLELEATPPEPAPHAVAPRRAPTPAEVFVAEGDRAFHAGDYSTAKRSYQRALSVSPAYLPARVGVAGVDWETGHRLEARDGYRAIVNDAPSMAPPIARERASMEVQP